MSNVSAWLPCSRCGKATSRFCPFHGIPICGLCHCNRCDRAVTVRAVILGFLFLIVVAALTYYADR